jgi:UDPglucose--hexose-1-phosphate uridylyltransferase
VVPNKFPALRIEEEPRRFRSEDGFESMGGCGAHEVIVESPAHGTPLALQPAEQVEWVLRTAQLRSQDLLRDRRFQAVVVFKNHGDAAGASLRHPHWQLIATPVVPRTLRQRHAEAEAYFDREGACLHCVLAAAERSDGVRLVAENDRFVAFVPYAAHVPFETWIFPRRHGSSFAAADPAELRPLAELLRSVLLRMLVGLDDPAFNLTIDTAPRGDEGKEYFLWHVRILPRLATPAGFELGSGMSINTVLPEEAAAFLRDVRVNEGTGASK